MPQAKPVGRDDELAVARDGAQPQEPSCHPDGEPPRRLPVGDPRSSTTRRSGDLRQRRHRDLGVRHDLFAGSTLKRSLGSAIPGDDSRCEAGLEHHQHDGFDEDLSYRCHASFRASRRPGEVEALKRRSWRFRFSAAARSRGRRFQGNGITVVLENLTDVQYSDLRIDEKIRAVLAKEDGPERFYFTGRPSPGSSAQGLARAEWLTGAESGAKFRSSSDFDRSLPLVAIEGGSALGLKCLRCRSRLASLRNSAPLSERFARCARRSDRSSSTSRRTSGPLPCSCARN